MIPMIDRVRHRRRSTARARSARRPMSAMRRLSAQVARDDVSTPRARIVLGVRRQRGPKSSDVSRARIVWEVDEDVEREEQREHAVQPRT